MHSNVWQLQEAKAKFSELVERAVNSGPQVVTRRGIETVVVLSVGEYRQGTSSRSLSEFFRREPYLDGLDLDRDKSLPREVEL